MERLPKSIKYDRWLLRQVKRSETAAIYQMVPTNDFEAIKIRIAPAENVFGQDLPEREIYPTTEEWGSYGWTYLDLPRAKAKFNNINENEQSRHPEQVICELH